MTRLLEVMGHPERAIPCIHIAGTNGKGSVAAMIESILRAAGWRTGLYTSPHLVRLGERVQVDRRSLSDESLVRYVRELQPVVSALEGEGSVPTYFELMTAIAFLHFSRSECDIAIVEVGLGGRLDATNVVVPEVSVITSVGLDHTDLLGKSLAEIAGEKAGIIKNGKPVVIGRLPEEAERVVRKTAEEHGALVSSVTAEFGDDLKLYPTTKLVGDYQRINAATATLAVRALPERWRLSDAVITRGLGAVDWAARWQQFELNGRIVIIDSSHNAEGAVFLDFNLRELCRESGRRPIVIAGMLGAERARALVPVICRHAREIHFVRPAQGRACTFEELEAMVPSTCAGNVGRSSIEHVFPGTRRCDVGGLGDFVVVTGSIYLAGEVLARIDPDLGPFEGHLQDF
jgi:dihydrofolate synthase/folylpolyglutamate synthase